MPDSHSAIAGFRLLLTALVIMVAAPVVADEPGSGEPDAKELVAAAMDHWRGDSSLSTLAVKIHRPDWTRTMRMKVWTAGNDRSLVRALEPEDQAGSGVLFKDGGMWSYSPDVDRVIRIPASMMSQQWLSSDFTNNEIARSDSLLEDYVPEILEHWEEDGLRHYRLRLEPHDEAPVVWGHQELVIRDDHILMTQAYYDQNGDPVKTLRTTEISELGGRQVAVRQRMEQADDDQRWTEITTEEAEYDLDLPDELFSAENLRNPQSQKEQ